MDLSVVETRPECNWNIQVQHTRPYYGSSVVRCLYPLLRNVAIQQRYVRMAYYILKILWTDFTVQVIEGTLYHSRYVRILPSRRKSQDRYIYLDRPATFFDYYL
jgi:hypothetical protein